MGEAQFRQAAISAVIRYFNTHRDNTDGDIIDMSNVYIVWMCKTLQNNKAMLSTTVSDGLYYEYTWNGDKQEGYLDVYKKWENVLTDDKGKPKGSHVK